MSLPTSWVDRIFEKLALVYGQAFLARWRDIDLNAVKSDWAHELSGYQHRPEAIAWALSNLPPEHAPTVLLFKALCGNAPAPQVAMAPEPKADPERLRAELAKLAPVLAKPVQQSVDGRDWARRIMVRHEAGEPLKRYTLESARMALGLIPGPVMS